MDDVRDQATAGAGLEDAEYGENLAQVARGAGLRELARPTLEQVERRRFELLGVTFFILLAVSAVMVVLTFAPADLRLPFEDSSVNFLRGAMVALALAFGAYVVEKERRLRRVTRVLLNERVFSAALMNRLREISLLSEAGRAVTSSLDLEEVLDIILKSASELLEADEGSVMLVHGQNLLVAAAVGRTSLFVGERREMSEGIAGYVARTNQPLLIEDEVEMTELTEIIGTTVPRSGRVLSSLSVPLEARGEVLGVLNLNVVHGDRRYEEYDLRLLQLFAQHAAVAIHGARILGADRELTRMQVTELERMRADVVGQMTTSFSAPTARQDADAGPEQAPTEHRAASGRRILLVEDDPGLLRFLQIALETEGYNVDLASDGETAVKRIDKEHFDVMLLDLAIPVMDGWGVLETLRGHPKRPRVLCLTAKDNRRDAARAWTLGADEFVQKPFELRDLVQLVGTVIDRSLDQQDERRREALKGLFSTH